MPMRFLDSYSHVKSARGVSTTGRDTGLAGGKSRRARSDRLRGRPRDRRDNRQNRPSAGDADTRISIRPMDGEP